MFKNALLAIITMALVACSTTKPHIATVNEFSGLVRVTKPLLGTSVKASTFNSLMSDSGHVLAFDSVASHITNPQSDRTADVFYYRESTDSVERVTNDVNGTDLDAIAILKDMTSDGKHILFVTRGSNVVSNDQTIKGIELYLKTMDPLIIGSGATELISNFTIPNHLLPTTVHNASISDDGRFILYDYSKRRFGFERKIMLVDRVSGASTDITGELMGDHPLSTRFEFGGKLSGDGKHIFYSTDAQVDSTIDQDSYLDIYFAETAVLEPSLYTLGSSGTDDGDSILVDVSYDGKTILFNSRATNILPIPTHPAQQVYISREDVGGNRVVDLVTHGITGVGATRISLAEALSNDGKYVLYTSDALDLFPSQQPGGKPSVLYNSESKESKIISRKIDGARLNSYSLRPFMSLNGRRVGFTTISTELDALDNDSLDDIYFFDLLSPP